ncbi:MAG TPA: hypothetical protein PLG59_00895 [bacterium]|nr:hypothetical protein [bacterium]
MTVRTKEQGDLLLVYLRDRVSMEDALEFGRTMKEAMEEEWRKIIVIVTSKVINSHCLGTLFASHRDALECGKTVCVVCDQPESRSSIRNFDPEKNLPLYHTLEEALLND